PGTIDYNYNDNLITEILKDGRFKNRFKYNDSGQVLSAINSDSIENIYNIEAGSNGYKFSISGQSSIENKDFIQYDQFFRPTFQRLNDNSEISWDYYSGDSMRIRIEDSQGYQYKILHSEDGKTERLIFPAGDKIEAEYNAYGQLISLIRNQKHYLRQKWNEDGTLYVSDFENGSYYPQYNEYGDISGILLTEPGEILSVSKWQEIIYDDYGRLYKSIDYTGYERTNQYDNNGNIKEISSNRGKIVVIRNFEGNIENIVSSWGSVQNYYYDSIGNIKRLEFLKNNKQSTLEFNQNFPESIRLFDGSEIKIAYNDHNDQIKEVNTPSLTLNYFYDEKNQISNININNRMTIEYKYDPEGKLIHIYKKSGNHY
ncbi:MAG: hypothetical protein K8R37_14605, partial [Bacteroidales bacterium]|nr:hypothetical protein [Bacteroidales bacterium]